MSHRKNEEEEQEYKQDENLHLHAMIYLRVAQTTTTYCAVFLWVSSGDLLKSQLFPLTPCLFMRKLDLGRK